MSRGSLRSAWASLPHPIRWVGVAVAGSTLVVIGAILLVLPGPGIPLLVLGLVVLATEFAWAERTVDRVRRHSRSVLSTVNQRFTRKESTS